MGVNNKAFITTLNDITRANRMVLPVLGRGEPPSGEFLSDWVKFLELCVKAGISLSDDRWGQLSIAQEQQYTEFTLDEGEDASPDPDFRVGLQLLMGMMKDVDE